MKYTLFSLILTSSLLYTGCTLFSLSQHKGEFAQPQQQDTTSKNAVVEIRFVADSPILPNSPSYHKGYGGSFAKNLFRTATHLVTGDYDRLVVTNQSGSVCPLQNIWAHPYADLALVKTTTDCFPSVFVPPYIPIKSLPSYLSYGNKKDKKITYKKITDHTVLLDEILVPGMSGAPVRGTNETLVGIVSAQQGSGTIAILLTEKILSFREDVLTDELVSY